MALTYIAKTAPVRVGRMHRTASGRLVLFRGYPGPGACYTSDDNGDTWTARTSGVSVSVLDVASHGSTVVAVGRSGVSRVSLDDGATWSATGLSPGSTTYLNFVRWLGDRFVIGGTNGRLYWSLSGAPSSWTQVSGISTSAAFEGAAYDAGKWVVATSTEAPGGLLYSADGETWAWVTIGGRGPIGVSGGIFVAGRWGEVSRSADGETWTDGTWPISAEQLVPHGPTWIAAGSGSDGESAVCISDDNAVSWSAAGPFGYCLVTALASNGQVALAAARRQVGEIDEYLFAQTVDGESWAVTAATESLPAVCNTLLADGDGFLAWQSDTWHSATGWVSNPFFADASATWYLVAPPATTTITLPLDITVESTAQTIALSLAIHQVPPVAVLLPLAVRRIDAAVFGGLDGAGGWPAAPDGRWRPVVVLDGVTVVRIIGEVSVSFADNEASTAEFSFLPMAPLAPLALVRRPVRIAFAAVAAGQVINAQPIFIGVVETADIDLQTGVVKVVCQDQLQEIAARAPREWIDAAVGGRWHVAVSGEPADNREYLEARIASVPKSYALDPLQQLRVIPWRGAGLRTATVRDADYLDGSLSITFPSAAQIRTRISVRLQYRYVRLRARGAIAQWVQGIDFFIPWATTTNSYPGVIWPTVAMVEGACNGVSGWELIAQPNIVHPPARSWIVGPTPEDGVYTITPAVAQDLVMGFTARFVTRWQQTVTEDYTIDVVCPALEEALGQQIPDELGATLAADFDQAEWSADTSVGPLMIGMGGGAGAANPPTPGDRSQAWQPSGADEAARDDVMRALLDQAWVRLYDSTRTGRVRFDLPLRPDVWLDWWMTVDTERLHADGKVVSGTHTLDTASGRAVTSIEIATGMPGNVDAAQPEWDLPAAPAPAYTPPISAYSFRVGTYVGGAEDSPPFDDETMIGFATNLNELEQEGREYYPHQLSMRSPDIAAEDRDPLDLTATATVAVDVPTQILEIG